MSTAPMSKKAARRKLLELYRYYFDGNQHCPDGMNIRVAISALEKELKEIQRLRKYNESY